MRGTLWATCCGLFAPLSPVDFLFLTPLHFFSFSPPSLSVPAAGEKLTVRFICSGLVSVLTCPWPALHTSMTVAWIVSDYRDIVRARVRVRLVVHAEAAAENIYFWIMRVRYSLSLLMLDQRSA